MFQKVIAIRDYLYKNTNAKKYLRAFNLSVAIYFLLTALLPKNSDNAILNSNLDNSASEKAVQSDTLLESDYDNNYLAENDTNSYDYVPFSERKGPTDYLGMDYEVDSNKYYFNITDFDLMLKQKLRMRDEAFENARFQEIIAEVKSLYEGQILYLEYDTLRLYSSIQVARIYVQSPDGSMQDAVYFLNDNSDMDMAEKGLFKVASTTLIDYNTYDKDGNIAEERRTWLDFELDGTVFEDTSSISKRDKDMNSFTITTTNGKEKSRSISYYPDGYTDKYSSAVNVRIVDYASTYPNYWVYVSSEDGEIHTRLSIDAYNFFNTYMEKCYLDDDCKRFFQEEYDRLHEVMLEITSRTDEEIEAETEEEREFNEMVSLTRLVEGVTWKDIMLVRQKYGR